MKKINSSIVYKEEKIKELEVKISDSMKHPEK